MNKKPKRCKIWQIVLLVCISVAIGLSVYMWNAKSITGNRMPMPFGFGATVVLSGSMEPELSVDDLAFISKSEAYEVGDVVVYQSGNILVIHRIIEIDGETVTTKGDANNAADDPFPVSAIKGKMVGKIKSFGQIWEAVKSPFSVLIIIFTAVILLFLSYKKERQLDKAENDSIIEEIQKLRTELDAGKERNSGED